MKTILKNKPFNYIQVVKSGTDMLKRFRILLGIRNLELRKTTLSFLNKKLNFIYSFHV